MVQKKKETAVVYRQECMADDIFDMWIETSIAEGAKAGQFVSVYPQNASLLLPRPISICEVDDARRRIRLVYRVAGKGTRELSGYSAGAPISILGPLGNGFPIDAAKGKKVFLMGGGIGIPPMLQLAKELAKANEGGIGEVAVIVGYRDGQLFLKEDLEKYATVYVATEDGSVGVKGNVMHAVKEYDLSADLICACGPMPMLRAIKEYSQQKGMDAYISLEERMACGVGACLGCVVKTKEIDHHSHVHNARICTDGPVYLAQEVEI